jgi:hypothetical protein
MSQYMLLLHMVPNYNIDLPREKMLEMTKRYMAGPTPCARRARWSAARSSSRVACAMSA